MKRTAGFGPADVTPAIVASIGDGEVYPRSFSRTLEENDAYLGERAAYRLSQFFLRKGVATLKEEERNEQWYADWLDYQAQHRIYASVLSPKQFSSLGHEFDLLKLTRFLEVFAYFSPAHGYSFQTTFLGLFVILMGTNDVLKREAVAALEAGELLAFGISEKDHGADLLGNEFTVTETTPGRFVANGSKYYIGNSNVASIITILARKQNASGNRHSKRSPLVLFALRPKQSSGYRTIRKIRTLGVRSAFVGEFEVKDHELPATDFIAEGAGGAGGVGGSGGRDAWNAVFGTVTLGKFFLGFGSIGICEHALEEAVTHLGNRILYRKPALDMPHIRLAMAQAYARLTAMKLYAYRALDYVHAARADDRRYLLYCAVQKAKVSTEGVKVIAQLSECMGAKGFESDAYFESALRDIQLIPSLEGSTHINLTQIVQFMPRYFAQADPDLVNPQSLTAGDVKPGENPYLFAARAGSVNDIAFRNCAEAYKPLMHVPNVRRFSRQVKAFRALLRGEQDQKQIVGGRRGGRDSRLTMACGQCMSTIAYAQLIAQHAHRLNTPAPMISAMFHLLVTDLSIAAHALAALPDLEANTRKLALRLIAIPKSPRGGGESDWDFVANKMAELTSHPPVSRSAASDGQPDREAPSL